MGNFTEEEKLGLSLLGIITFPFFLIKEALYFIGILERPQHEYDSSKDPNYKKPE